MRNLIPVELHENLPLGYYRQGIKVNPFQRFWHLRRFKKISKLIDPVKGAVLDIGCADATFTEVIARKSKATKVVGIDILKAQIDDDRKRFRHNRQMRFLVADAHDLPFANNFFEAVFCLEAMEHVHDQNKVLREIKRVLRDGGYIILLVPTDTFLFKICWWFVLHTFGKHWKNTHIQDFDHNNSLAKKAETAGFKVINDHKFLWGMLNVVKAIKP